MTRAAAKSERASLAPTGLSEHGPGGKLAAWALLLALCGLFYLLLAAPYLAAKRETAATFAHNRDLIARYREVAARVPTYEAQLTALRGRQAASGVYLSGESDALAAAELQQRINRLVVANGAKVRSMQILPTESEGAFQRVGVRLQLLAKGEPLHEILYALEAERPLLFIARLEIRNRQTRRRAGQVDDDPNLQVTIDIVGYLPPELG